MRQSELETETLYYVHCPEDGCNNVFDKSSENDIGEIIICDWCGCRFEIIA